MVHKSVTGWFPSHGPSNSPGLQQDCFTSVPHVLSQLPCQTWGRPSTMIGNFTPRARPSNFWFVRKEQSNNCSLRHPQSRKCSSKLNTEEVRRRMDSNLHCHDLGMYIACSPALIEYTGVQYYWKRSYEPIWRHGGLSLENVLLCNNRQKLMPLPLKKSTCITSSNPSLFVCAPSGNVAFDFWCDLYLCATAIHVWCPHCMAG